MARTDAEVIAASVGEPEMFAELFDRHYPTIAAFFRRRLERSLADELAAETFTRAFDGRERYDRDRADARPWLFGIATKLLSGQRRKERRLLRALARSAEASHVPDQVDEIASRVDACASAGRVAAALASLASRDRDALLLFACEELSYEEISTALGIPVGTVRSRLHRARVHLRADLAPSAPPDPIVVHHSGDKPHEQRA